MKSVLRFVPVCLFLFYFTSSCRVASIKIVGAKNTGELSLVDAQGNRADTIEVFPGQKIKWKISKSSNIKSIDSIDKKAQSDDVLRGPARKKHFSRTWKARTKTDAELKALRQYKAQQNQSNEPIYEEYFIDWTDQKGERRRYDPRIQIKSMTAQ